MKMLFLIFLVLAISLNGVSAQESDCEPTAVKEWMVQRQVGRNQLQSIIDGSSQASIPDALLLVQKVRRDLEDLPRPACADELYQLTIYFYNAWGDALGFGLKQDTASITSIVTPRLERYVNNVDTLYLPLEQIAGVDVMAETAALGSVPATAAPTEVVVPLEWNGTDATVIGPIRIPAGIYRATATTSEFMSVAVTPTEGECGAGSGGFTVPGLFNLSTGQGATGAEAILTSKGCSALIAVSNVQASWALKFERVG